MHAGRLAGILRWRGRDCNASQKKPSPVPAANTHAHTPSLGTIPSFSETSGHIRADRLTRDSGCVWDPLRSSDQLPPTHTHLGTCCETCRASRRFAALLRRQTSAVNHREPPTSAPAINHDTSHFCSSTFHLLSSLYLQT